MIQSRSQEKDTVSEKEFLSTASDCFLLFEQYKLKTNVVGINLEKEMIPQCYYELEGRMLERYDMLFEQLQKAINNLEINFKIAKATHLRSLNNIMRNYRRRVGTVNNEPMGNFKYNRFDRSQKILLQALVYHEKDSYEEILKFKQELTIATEQGKNEIRDHYRRNPKITQDFRHVFEVIDKTECYTYKYYENFERSMQTTVASLESYFDKLNGYLTVWENLGSIKAYEIKSAKELAMEGKKNDPYGRRFNEEYDQKELQQLIERCPDNSSKKEQYKLRLVELRQVNKEKERKMEKVGKMFNRRRNRDGILTNRRKDITVLDWYFNLENEKANFSFNDDLKLAADSTQNETRPTEYEIQKPFKKERLDQIKGHMEKYQKSVVQNHSEWWYDKYGKEGIFDLILCTSQQIQKRVQFEVSRQMDYQTADDRKKRDIFDRQTNHLREAQRRQALHIGYLYANEKEEIEQLQDRTYNIEYFPDLIAAEVSDSSLEFTDQELQHSESSQSEKQVQIRKEKKVKKKQQNTKKVEVKHIQTKPVQPKQEKKQIQSKSQASDDGSEQNDSKEENFEFNNASLEEQLIKSYFKEYSKKVMRKEAQPEYKQSKFLYFSDLSEIKWSILPHYFPCEKIFIYTKEVIIYMKRVFSAQKEKIKCIVYTLKDDLDEEIIREELTNCFIQLSLVTVKFVSIYSDLEGQDKIYFMIGLLLILVQKGQMVDDYEPENYIKEGKIIVEDFHCYFNPQEHYTSKNLFMRIRNSKAVSVFAKKDKNQDEQPSKQFEGVSEGTQPTLISSKLDQQKVQKPQQQAYQEAQTHERHVLKHSSSRQNLKDYEIEKALQQRQKSQQSKEDVEEDENEYL